MSEITMIDVTNEVERVLASKTVTTKETLTGTLVSAGMVVGGYFLVRRWVDSRIDRKIKENQK